jgi:hypothetical protein
MELVAVSTAFHVNNSMIGKRRTGSRINAGGHVFDVHVDKCMAMSLFA